MDTQHEYSYEDRAEDIRHLLEKGDWVPTWRYTLPPYHYYLTDALDDFYYAVLRNAIDVEAWSDLEGKLSTQAIKALGSEYWEMWDDFLDQKCLRIALHEPR